MDQKKDSSYRMTEEEGPNGQIMTTTVCKCPREKKEWSVREKVLCFCMIIVAILALALIIVLAIKLEVKNDNSDADTTSAPSGQNQHATKNAATTSAPSGHNQHAMENAATTSAPSGHNKHAMENVCISSDCVKEAASLLKAIDFSIDPCQDFYEFACGNWMKSHTIPDDKSQYVRFGEVRDNVQLKLKVRLEEPIAANELETITKVKKMYKSCINEDLIKKRGLDVVKPLIRELGGWPVTNKSWTPAVFNLEELMIRLAHYNNKILVEASVAADDKNSSVHIIVIDQADLGMPSRDYYLKNRSDEIIMAYEKMAYSVARAFGADEAVAKKDMKDVVDFEIKIAKLTLPKDQRRDMDKLYNRMNIAQLQKEAPKLNWLKYLQGLYTPFYNITIDKTEEVVVYTPEYLKNMLDVVKKTNPRIIMNYFLWRIMMHRVNNLAEEYRMLQKEYNKVVSGQKRELPKWAMCIEYVNNNMGDAVGRLFIDKYFDKEAKNNAIEMISYLRTSFNNLLRRAEWMDKETKAFALEKAHAIVQKIGYPDDLLNDTALNQEFEEIDFQEDKYFENVLTVLRTLFEDNAWYLRQPVDQMQWTTYAAVVNAFYSPNRNSITFPAAILQPPFYSKEYPMSLMFGGIGMVIGHEITHGFDDEGRQFDKVGNFFQWWTNSSLQNFKQLTQCLVDQYSAYKMNGDHIRGLQTLGENMADNGGIRASFEAYQQWIKKNGEEKLLPGLNLTHNQLFFVNFAQGWCSLSTKEATHNQLMVDSHTPGMYRVIGVVSNSKYFSEEYKCPVGSPMNPKHKCGVW